MEYKTFQLPSPYWKQTCNLRLEVFVNEQGVPEELEIDELDLTAQHFIAINDNHIAGTLRLVFKGKIAKLGRLAVAKQERKKGIATQLIKNAEQFCQQRHIDKIRLGAQVSVKAFYRKLGYREEGEIFMDAGIPHIYMLKNLN